MKKRLEKKLTTAKEEIDELREVSAVAPRLSRQCSHSMI
jgi:hypothetical protein